MFEHVLVWDIENLVAQGIVIYILDKSQLTITSINDMKYYAATELITDIKKDNDRFYIWYYKEEE